MSSYPLFFEAQVSSPSGVQTPLQAKSGQFPAISCAIPKEFKGSGEGYSPEDLFVLSLLTCLIATFKVFAQRTALAYQRIEGSGKLKIDRNPKGAVEFQSIEIHLILFGVQDREKGEKILLDLEKYCFVSHAIKVEKKLTYTISVN